MYSKLTRSVLAVLVIGGTVGLAISCKKDNTPSKPVTPNPPADVNLKKGLLVYLPFEGNFADSSGNKDTTILFNGPSLTYDEHGYSNNAFGASGNGAQVRVINNGSLKFDSAFSVSFDFMIRAVGINYFVALNDYYGGKGFGFAVSTGAPGSPNLCFGVSTTTSSCDQWVVNNVNGYTDTTNFAPQPEAWYNCICTFNKGVMQVFVNGTLISTKTSGSPVVTVCPSAQLGVGGWWSGDLGASLNGKMDEVRLYNRVLNADEIAQLSQEFQDVK